MPEGFIPPHGRYQELQSYKKSLVVYQATRKFCRDFFHKYDRTIDQMVQGVEERRHDLPGQLIIYPQGTRVAAGAHIPYKIGSGVLYEGLQQDCVPAAANVGVFWPRHGIYRKRGTAIVEFLPTIKAGKPVKDFMAELEEVVESNSNRLMAEAGFHVKT